MKAVDLTAATPTLDELLALASGDNVILRTREGREFVLAELDDFDREIELVRQNAELMSMLDERSKDPTRLSLEEVRRELGL